MLDMLQLHWYVSSPFHFSGLDRDFFFLRILQNDFPQLKYALLGGLGLLAFLQRE